MTAVTNIENYTINFGPQHPAAHGVMRMILELRGETVERADVHIGLLHRGTEKLMEAKPYTQSIGYLDRLDYCSCLNNEHAFVLAVEKLLGIEVPKRAQYIRVLLDETTRIMNHLMWLGAHGHDLGAMAMLLYCFRDREELYDVQEAITGARIHPFYYRIGGVAKDLPNQMPQYAPSKFRSKKKLERINKARQGDVLDFLEDFCDRFVNHNMVEYKNLLVGNRIWKGRVVGIGVVTAERAIELGFTGPMLRGSGVAWDLRKTQPYSVYDELDFEVPVGVNGDCYDRFLVRLEEMIQSAHLVKQCIAWLRENKGPVMSEDSRVTIPQRRDVKEGMESLIQQFKVFTEGFCVPEGESYAAVEHPKGEFGTYIVSDGANKPYRVKFRSPGFAHISATEEMARYHMLSDLVAILGTQDMVFGDIDR
ncbi:NADH-quinone oxidoreductase subunit D [Ignatzschineria sp. LJL83]